MMNILLGHCFIYTWDHEYVLFFAYIDTCNIYHFNCKNLFTNVFKASVSKLTRKFVYKGPGLQNITSQKRNEIPRL